MALLLRVICLLTLIYLGPAGPLSLLTSLSTVTAAEAQESSKVWVNTKSGVYHCPGSRYYGKTKTGAFMSEPEALGSGNRPAYGQGCGTSSAAPATTAPERVRAVEPATATSQGTKVWVNTKAGVYHCPGSRYYGSTRSGRFMSEPEARAAGNRPAYGRGCG